jgi:hypothetical protein
MPAAAAAVSQPALPDPEKTRPAARRAPDVPRPRAAQPQSSSGAGGRVIGIIGLIVAALLLRGQVKTPDERAIA